LRRNSPDRSGIGSAAKRNCRIHSPADLDNALVGSDLQKIQTVNTEIIMSTKTQKTPKKNPAAVALGRLGRAANSKAQAEASRSNGQAGGRPRLSPIPFALALARLPKCCRSAYETKTPANSLGSFRHLLAAAKSELARYEDCAPGSISDEEAQAVTRYVAWLKAGMAT